MLRISHYHRPATIDQAIGLLLQPGATVVGGGTDLLVNPRFSNGIEAVVDLGLLGLDYITRANDQLHIGASTVMREVARSPLVRSLADGIVARGAAVCGSPNNRNLATIGGNLGSALPSADTPPPLLALDASVVLVGPSGLRRLTLPQYFQGPAQTAREPGEIIMELTIPICTVATRGGFYKLTRTADDIAITNAAATLEVVGQSIVGARLAVGAVAPTPLRVIEAEAFLVGKPPSPQVLEAAAAMAAAAARPITDHRASADYRRRMAQVCALRALNQAAGLSPQGRELDHG